MIKSLTRTSWLVEMEDTLHPNSDPSYPRLIQVVVEYRDSDSAFHFLPWRVIQTIPRPDGTDHVITAGIPDTRLTWEWIVPMAKTEMFDWLSSEDRELYTPGKGGKA